MSWMTPRWPRNPAGSVKAALLCLLISVAAIGPALADGAREQSQAFYEEALKHVGKGDLGAAVVELKNAAQRDPGNVDARLLLGELYVRVGKGAAAEDELRAAERHGASAETTIVLLGRALLLQGRFEDLLAEVDPAAYGPALDLELKLQRAQAQAALGRLAAARESYEGIVRDYPEDAGGYLGLAQLDLVARSFAAAQTQATAALARAPDNARAKLLRAEALRLGAEPEAALAVYRDLLDGTPVPAATRLGAHKGLASTLIALTRDEEAEKELLKAEAMVPGDPATAYLRALIKLRAGDFRAARQILDTTGGALDDYIPAQYLFGVIHFAAEEFESARSWFSRYLNAQPEHLQARKLLAASLLRLDAAPDAAVVLEAGLEQAAGDPQILMLLGNAYLRSGRPVEATELFQRAAGLLPADPRLLDQLTISHLATGDYDDSLATLKASLDLDAESISLGYAIAFNHLRSGNFDEALRVARELRVRFPESAVAANLEGGAYAALGQTDEARAAFEQALEIEPGFEQARANLAAVKARAGDSAGAEADYTALLESDAESAVAMLGLAGLARQRGDAQGSREWLEQAVAAHPDELRVNLALAESHAAAGEPDAALDLLTRLARRQPGQPQVLSALGELQMRSGSPADAIATFRRVVQLTDGSAQPRLRLALAQIATGEREAARQTLRPVQDLLAQPPGDDGLRLALAEILLSLGDLEQARSQYEILKETQAGNPTVWNNLAWLYQQTGDARALAHGEQALALAPGQPAIMDTLAWILLDAGEVSRASDLLRQAHQAVPESPDIAYHYAVALHKQGQDKSAAEILRQLLASERGFAARADAEDLLARVSN